MLTLVMGLSVAQICREMGLDAWIKWPNDVVVSGKKDLWNSHGDERPSGLCELCGDWRGN